jgi:integrase
MPEPVSHTICRLGEEPWAWVEAEVHRINQMIRRGDFSYTRKARREALTFGGLVDEWRKDIFVTDPPRIKASTLQAYDRRLNKWILPALGKLRLDEITRRHIEDLHAKITRCGARVRANRAVTTIGTIFAYGINKDLCSANPAKGVTLNKEMLRVRYTEGEELERLLTAIAECESIVAVRAIRLLMLTGARVSELLQTEWSQVNLATGVWSKPPSSTKTAIWHTIPLSPPACQIFAELRAEAEARAANTSQPVSRWVFPAGKTDRPVVTIKAAWAGILKRAGIDNLRVHDLRHFCGSYLASSGTSLPLIGRLLGHAKVATTMRYAHVALHPVRREVNRIAEYLDAVESGRTAEVVDLSGRKAG